MAFQPKSMHYIKQHILNSTSWNHCDYIARTCHIAVDAINAECTRQGSVSSPVLNILYCVLCADVRLHTLISSWRLTLSDVRSHVQTAHETNSLHIYMLAGACETVRQTQHSRLGLRTTTMEMQSHAPKNQWDRKFKRTRRRQMHAGLQLKGGRFFVVVHCNMNALCCCRCVLGSSEH